MNSLIKNFMELERTRKEKHTAPQLNNFFAVIYVAITTIILAYGALFGFVSILIMYAIWLPKIRFKGVWIIKPRKDTLLILLFPAIALLSVAWSDYRPHSLYSALEYASLILCTIIIAKIVRAPAFIRGIVIGSALVLLASLVSGNYEIDPMTGKTILIGFFGSKNMVGLFAEIGIFLSLLSLFIRQSFIEKILFALMPLAIFVISLYVSKSASSVLSLAVVLAAIPAAVLLVKIPRPFRMLSFISGIFIIFLLTAIGIAFNAQNAILSSFGKNTTLTGRTHLWSEGIKIGQQSPYLGHGYSAFWVEGQPKAEQLWQEFGVTAKVGFHFHNVFLETFVELGALGVAIIILLILTNCWSSLRLIIRSGLSLEYLYALGISVMFLTRAMVEVDIIGTFSIGPLLFYSVIPRLAAFRYAGAAYTKPPLP